jgi:protoporphyrinogen oxidase
VHVQTLILGGGLTGLSAACHLERLARARDLGLGNYLLVERDARLGGLTRTEVIAGYHFDHTGHWLHLRHAEMKAFVSEVAGDVMHEVARKSRIWSHGAMTHFPFQQNLHGLPKDVLYECLHGAIEAALKEARGEFGPPSDFHEFCLQRFGPGITRHFMVPYNTKLWGCQPEEITADWCSRFLPRPNIAQITAGALGLVDDEAGYNAHFVYPREGGIEAFAKRLVQRIPAAKVRLQTVPHAIDLATRTVTLSDGSVIGWERIVSSLPVPELLRICKHLPESVREAGHRLRCTSLRYLVYGIARPDVLGDVQWLYVPEPKYPFYRIGSFSNAVKSLAPAGKSALYVECANNVQASDDEQKQAVRAFLRERGWLHDAAEVEVEEVRHIKYGYVVFDRHYFPAKEAILPYLLDRQVHSLGRYGAWVYSSMEDALWDGYRYAEDLATGKLPHAE